MRTNREENFHQSKNYFNSCLNDLSRSSHDLPYFGVTFNYFGRNLKWIYEIDSKMRRSQRMLLYCHSISFWWRYLLGRIMSMIPCKCIWCCRGRSYMFWLSFLLQENIHLLQETFKIKHLAECSRGIRSWKNEHTALWNS